MMPINDGEVHEDEFPEDPDAILESDDGPDNSDVEDEGDE